MTDAQARARVWTLCLAALVRAALTSPLVGLLTPPAQASSLALTLAAAVLALLGAYVALVVLLIVAILRVVRPRPDGRRNPCHRAPPPPFGRGCMAGSYFGAIRRSNDPHNVGPSVALVP